jgi:myo-inositol-1(or 4)-monophosphatase
MLKSTNWTNINRDATEFVVKAAEIIRANTPDSINATHKKDHSIVTRQDKKIEKLLTKFIQSKYPHHHIYGEEYGGNLDGDEPIWIIDPIEGTTNFYYGTSMLWHSAGNFIPKRDRHFSYIRAGN